MAAGLKRDPVVILRIDGEDLREFLKGSTFELEMVSIFSKIDLPRGSLKDCVVKAFEKLSVDQGMPPSTDQWVMSNTVEPALQSLASVLDLPVSEETFFEAFHKSVERVAQILKEKPAIVAHSQNTFNGSGIRKLMSNKFELDKTLDLAVQGLPKDRNGKLSKELLGLSLDTLAASAGLPPLGVVDEMDTIMNEAIKLFEAGDGKPVKEGEFKALLTEVLGSIMLQLEGNPVSLFINSVVPEQTTSSSTILNTPPS